MIGVQNHNGHDKPFLGCLGHVVNLFDLSAGMTGNRMLTDKSHREGSPPLSRSRSDVSGMSLVEDQIQDKVTISELQRNSSNRTAHGTPVKMLIAEEMSKEVESKQKQPNVVAKLMGLEALPLQQSETQKCHSRGSSRSQSCVSFGSWQEEHELHQHQEQIDRKDVYEIRHSDNRYVINKSPQKESFNRDIIDKKMALVRHNFIELKRLSTDEKLRQSKQFRDALEVLSSNKDSFLQFLQEPNSMFSQQLSNLQSVSPPYETKRITILKPANMVDGYSVTGSPKKNEKKIDKSHFSQINWLHKNSSGFSPQTSCKPENSQGHTTRIVVLKPAPGKPREIKDVASPLSSKPNASRVEDPYVVVDNDDAQESSEVAKEINRQMAENLSQHRRDIILHPSFFSNGFTGDESSFTKSEIEYAVENLGDPEAISPTSRHSWSYINRFDSPYMLSSFSRASNSPESSVCREAKKRLSERWAMMASDGSQEQKHVRSSSTLGEMLALSDMKKTVITKEDCLTNKHHFRGSTSCFTSELNDEDKCNTPARNILRSKSVPVSSKVYSGGVLISEVSDPKMEKTDIPKDLTKTRSMISFLKGRVSSLFFSRNNKSSKQKVNSSREEFEPTELARHCFESDVDIGVEAGEIPDLLGSGNKSSPLQSLDEDTIEDRVYSTKAAFSATKLFPFRGPIEKQGQPNPVSVLEPPFQEDDHREPEFTDNFSLLRNGFDLPVCPVKFNLIDKSPLVGSINARTLSWNDSCTENLSPYHSKSYAVQVSAEEERQEMFFLVETLLAAAELGNESLCDTFLARWHSLESPLDPLLRDIYAGLNVKETLHEAKRIPRRSVQKLVFDCVNAALVELAMYGLDPWKSGTCWLHDQGSIVDYVWTQMEWFSGEVSCVKGEGMERNSLAVERLVRKEVVGKGGADHTRLEIDNFCKEIEVNLLEELVQETVEEFTGSF